MSGSGAELLLRLEVVTPANLGSAAGAAVLDRPTQKDAWLGLPYLPDSALKGVLAAPHGNLPSQGENAPRERLFGSPDRADRGGRPGPLVIGNGELLAFPLAVRGGGTACVVPALAAARFLAPDGAPAEEEDRGALDLLREIEDTPGKAFGWGGLPALDSPVVLEALAPAAGRRGGSALAGSLRRLAGPGLSPGAPLVVVAAAAAGALWRSAAERRVLTALDSDRRTVVRGTLRAVELVPAETVFLSRVSLLDGAELPLPERFQVGAWEGLGLGWVRPSWVAPRARAQTPAAGSPPGGPAPPRPIHEARVMVAMHQAIRGLRLAGEAEVRSAAAPAIDSFGPRAHLSGLEAALAFELAKAKLAQPDPKPEARAHRWLLSALLTPDPDPRQAQGPRRALLEGLGTPPFDPAALASRRDLIMTRWRWLRRYAELGLDG